MREMLSDKGRQISMKQNGAEIDPHIYGHLIFNEKRKFSGKSIVFQQISKEQLDIHMIKWTLIYILDL